MNKTETEVDHWSNLAEFCKWEMWSGGPDPQISLTGRMGELDGVDWPEKVWRGLCYVGAYVVPTASMVWKEWPWERVNKEGLVNFEQWAMDNWKGIALRKERKCVRSPVKFYKFFNSAAKWLYNKINKDRGWIDSKKVGKERYDAAWEDVTSIYTMGRYVAIKFLEYGNRYLDFRTEIYDVRTKGGWSPRTALSLLWPEYKDHLLGDDSTENLKVSDRCAKKTKEKLEIEYGTKVSFFQLQVCLCEYKQTFIKKHHYPGRSHDTEMNYERKIRDHFGLNVPFYNARKSLFPNVCLGELSGWDYVRDELGKCLVDHGYTWTDSKYNYVKSKEDLKNPVIW
jgi:hypothetical protein